MSKYTPGPWKAIPGCDNEHGVTDHIAIFGDGWHIARVWGDAANPDADARLIAAAPEMRETLNRIMSAAGNPDAAEGCRIIIAIAQAAIAKAEGRE